MAQVNVRLAEDLREQAKEVAQQQQISLNQFCVTAIAYAIGESQARRFFAGRAEGLSPEDGRRKMADVLGKVRG